MNIEETKIKGCYLLTPQVFEDKRGSFHETFNEEEFNSLIGQKIHFVQDNQSTSKKGVLRGMHFQTGKYSQAKLVRVLAGSILDVVIDLRPQSETFGEHYKVELNADSNQMLFIPKGMAHGFLTLSEYAIFHYKCDAYYNAQAESGIRYDDPELNINWPIDSKSLVLSEKDQQVPNFNPLKL